MEDSFERLIFPTIEEICEVNRSLSTTTGGAFYPPFNLQNPSGLTWALDYIQSPFLFGNSIYPTLSDKTAFLAWISLFDSSELLFFTYPAVIFPLSGVPPLTPVWEDKAS